MNGRKSFVGFVMVAILGLQEASAQISVPESVLTQHNDNERRGAYLTETKLKPSNVNASTFGHLYKLGVDGAIVAQPLYTKEMLPEGRERDVLYVATRRNKLYAFDVTNGDPGKPVWMHEFPDVPPTLPGQPVTAVWRDSDHLDLFTMDRNGRVLSNYWDKEREWHEWFSIRPDTGLGLAGEPQQITAVWGDPNNAQHLNLFMTDKDGAVKSIYCTLQPNEPCWKNESWFAIGAKGTATPGQPVTALWRDKDHLDLFIAGHDGRVLSNFWETRSGWHEWFPIRPDTGVAAAGRTQQITALWGDPNNAQHLNLFMTDKDGAVKSIYCTIQSNRPCWQTESWFALGPPGMATPGQPVTALWRDGQHLDLFIAGRDGKILSNFWDNGPGWREWFAIREDTGLAAAGKPQLITAVWGDPNNARHLNLFMTDKDGLTKSIYCTILPHQFCWKNESWFAVSAVSARTTPGQPVTAVWRDGTFAHLDLFATGAQRTGNYLLPHTRDWENPLLRHDDPLVREGTVISNWWENASSWGPWFPVPLRAEALPGMDDGPSPCLQTHGLVGIVSTPVIDANTHTMYVVYRTGFPLDAEHRDSPIAGQNYRFDAHHWLAAIDIRNGENRLPPVEISTPGFHPEMQLNRPALLLHDGAVMVAFGAAVCDLGGNPYVTDKGTENKPLPHGWIFAFRADTLKQQASFTTAGVNNAVAPNILAGIWQSGNGLAADLKGNMYAFTGNNFYANLDKAHDLSESILKLRVTASDFLVKYYRVPEAEVLDVQGNDGDLGAGGPLLPFDNLLVGGGKQGVLYAIKDPARGDSGTARAPTPWSQLNVHSFQAFYNTHTDTDATLPEPPKRCDPTILNQYAPQHAGPNIHGSPVVWTPAGADYAFIYGMPEKDYVRAFKAHLSGSVDSCPSMTTEAQKIRSPQGMPGGFLSVSANGDRDGIIWASAASDGIDATNTFGQDSGRLIALDALTLKKLWENEGEQQAQGMVRIPFAKFVPPTVAGGRVFRAAYKDWVHVYGLKQ